MDKMKPVFEALNKELIAANLNLTIICVGGYVLEYHGLRATQDVDAFYEENQKINEIIAKVGQQFSLNTHEELWLNNNVANMNRQPPIELCETVYYFENLIVLIAPIEYVLGMKMVSSREQDLKDIAAIIKYKHLHSPFNTFDSLKKQGFENIDFSVLLEGFSYAYGIRWLEEFFKENQDQLSHYY
ncbi:DUF6036 family nucleotidyltransferase [Streptococcus didelphis]|uniref:DUF6036 family nucleotidyltransferase n=1 Tax=Streptococcus didelphis TaxID=102886 RepID=A0ABY9LIX3_9STRE|nr:DUF6036 family nucleotidyltransferase [Streptococcus didelphis]WMB28750.1 DUF6036 family nucleotidyltransferase [Streptococcus didelphis]WMB29411.1 DUF6036 family nucleotidyltransferase [Streptococcus didelphis]